jgi:hypothetical protein
LRFDKLPTLFSSPSPLCDALLCLSQYWVKPDKLVAMAIMAKPAATDATDATDATAAPGRLSARRPHLPPERDARRSGNRTAPGGGNGEERP